MSLIIFHELGHFLTAKVFNWKVDKIYIYPLGGLTKFNERINVSFIEELLVTLMGPIFQIGLSLYLRRYYEEVMVMNKVLLLFNLLPIVPLDGGKLLSLMLQKIVPYYKNLNLTLIISLLSYLVSFLYIVFFIPSLFIILVVFLLIFKIYDEFKLRRYYFNKFLLERSLYNYNFKRVAYVKSIYGIYRFRRNIYKSESQILGEKDLINFCFNNVKSPIIIVNNCEKCYSVK